MENLKSNKNQKIYLDSCKNQDNPTFEILSFFKGDVKIEKVPVNNIFRFVGWCKNKYTYNKVIVGRDDENFNKILSDRGEYYINSILRKSDGEVLEVGDKIDRYTIMSDGERYYDEIDSFWLDGELYMQWRKLKSESGIQAFFGGGEFIDISNVKLKK